MKTNIETKHTPTPWKVSMPIGEGTIAILSEKVNAFGNFYVLEMPNRIVDGNASQQTEENKANAEFIARAVNSHQDLIHTLSNALHELRGVNANEFIIKQCEKAITQAMGKQQ
jgi:hypothetical protein